MLKKEDLRFQNCSAHVLLLIREGKANDRDALFREVVGNLVKSGTADARFVKRRLDEILASLARAGLIQGDEKSTYRTTQVLDDIQHALELSLSELAKSGAESVVASPLFGRPDEESTRFDAFVVMPFSARMAPVYEDHIKPVCEALKLSVGRADDIFSAQAVIQDIWDAICNCRVLVADCTGRNPNVFYEIGVAHTVGVPTILVAQNDGDIPFDLRHIRRIRYRYTPRGMQEFERRLRATIKSELRLVNRTKQPDDE